VSSGLTRVDAVLRGQTLACVANDLTAVAAAVSLQPGGRFADLVVRDLGDAAWLVVRRGADAGTEATSVSVRGIECFALLEDSPTPLIRPATLRLAATPQWSRFYGAPGDGLATQIRYLQFAELTEPRYMPWLEDLEVLIAPREQISQAVYVSGLYEPSTSLMLRRLLHEGDTFIDVGANIGLFSMLASRWIGSSGLVLSLEPSRRECDRLREHIAHNRLDNVRVFQVAAGRHGSEALLHVADERHSGLNTLKSAFMYPDVTESHAERVRVVTLDDLVEQQRVSKTDVIKIDVEGSECEVLMGARRLLERDRPVVILEIAGEAASREHEGRVAVEMLLRSLGYAFAALDGDQATIRRVDELVGQMENFVAAMPAVLEQLVAAPAASSHR
jgi:FkbM family methyltransferase